MNGYPQTDHGEWISDGRRVDYDAPFGVQGVIPVAEPQELANPLNDLIPDDEGPGAVAGLYRYKEHLDMGSQDNE